MTYLFACTVATLLLAVFISAIFFMHLVREKQHKRHKRENEALLVRLRDSQAEVKDLTDANLAAERLDEVMRRTIGEGIDLARALEQKQQHFADLVKERRGQIAVELSTLDTWAKIRDDLTAWAERYPGYMFQADSGERGES